MTVLQKIEITVAVIAMMAMGLFLAFITSNLLMRTRDKIEAWTIYMLSLAIFAAAVIYQVYFT